MSTKRNMRPYVGQNIFTAVDQDGQSVSVLSRDRDNCGPWIKFDGRTVLANYITGPTKTNALATREMLGLRDAEIEVGRAYRASDVDDGFVVVIGRRDSNYRGSYPYFTLIVRDKDSTRTPCVSVHGKQELREDYSIRFQVDNDFIDQQARKASV